MFYLFGLHPNCLLGQIFVMLVFDKGGLSSKTRRGDLLGVEVRDRANVGKDDFKHLKWFGGNLAKVPYTGIVLYTGERVQRFGEGYYAVPMSCLT